MIADVIRIRLAEQLEKNGITLYRLAKDTGIAYEALRKVRDGEVTRIYLDTIEKICRRLECTPNDLLEIAK
jgi:DNA-binding Xre family transcriptional regulator